MRKSTRVATAATVAILAGATAGSGIASADTTTAPAPTTAAPAAGCTPLHLLIVNGTTESSPTASTTEDSGFGSRIAIPAVNDAGKQLLSRSYVPYAASFGGKPGDKSTDTYQQSIEMGIKNAAAMLTDLAQKCPAEKVFLVGYSQGAQVASAMARQIGAGQGPIDAAKLAGAALFSDPTRRPDQPVFAAGGDTPAAVPGTSGAAVSKVPPAVAATPAGAGIAPNTAAPTFGSVADRVASFCTAGDLACDTPVKAPIVRMVANIAGQSKTDPNDPIGALTSIGTALGTSVLFTGASVVNNNIDFQDGHFEVGPSSDTVLSRMATYSDPLNTPEGTQEAVQALTKIAGMAIGAAVTVAQDVLSPASIAQIAAAGVAGPEAALGVLGARLLAATIKLVPPVTLDQGVNLAFDELQRDVTDNAGLVKMAVDTSYWDTIQKHGSYTSTPVGAKGQTPVQLATDWIVAAAHDIAGTAAKSLDTSGTGTGSEFGNDSDVVLASKDTKVLTAQQILGTTATSTPPTATVSAAPSAVVQPNVATAPTTTADPSASTDPTDQAQPTATSTS